MNASLYRSHYYYFGQLIIFNIYRQSVTTHTKATLTIIYSNHQCLIAPEVKSQATKLAEVTK